MDRVIRRSCELAFIELDTAVSLSCYLLLRSKEYDQLVAKRVDPSHYLDTVSGCEKYYRDVRAVDLLRKAPLETTLDRRKAAMDTFHLAEEQCYRTNRYLSLVREYPHGALEHAAHEIMRKAKKWIGRVFGALPDDLPWHHGPGTTFELEGSIFATVADKLTTAHAVTSDCVEVFTYAWAGTHPARKTIREGRPFLQQVRGNRFVTVPKDGKTDRGICVEPGGNLYTQLGVGSYLKERLGAVGIHVWREHQAQEPSKWYVPRPHAESIHRRLAREGSVDDGWSTIDLSNASDTLALELIRWILPPDWYTLLGSMRSSFTRLKKRWHRLEKFSSMGNGYTFELETAVFCAITHGVTGLLPGRDFFVYGDDIVVPKSAYRDTVAALRFFGFTPNDKKTFTSGPFRESCGGDYFLGYNVRPFQVKTLDTSIDALRALHNGYVRNGLLLAAKHVASCIPRTYRSFGPARLGDSILHGGTSSWSVTTRHSIRWVKTHIVKWRAIPLDRWGEDFVLSLALLGAPSDGIVPRRSTAVGMKVVWLSVS